MRLLRFALLALLAVALAVPCALAWAYMDALTRPGCLAPTPLPGYAYQEDWLTLEDGTRLRVWYYPGAGERAVLALGGLHGSLGERLPPVEFLLAAGYPVLQVDSLACADPPRRVTLGARERQVALAAVDYLAARHAHVVAFGFSMGGVTAIRTAAVEPRLEAVIAEGGYHNLGEHITRPGQPKSPLRAIFLHTVALTFWLQTGENPWHISPVDDIAGIAPRPVLLLFGENEIARARGVEQFAAAPSGRLWLIPGGDHGTNYARQPAAYAARVLAFLAALP